MREPSARFGANAIANFCWEKECTSRGVARYDLGIYECSLGHRTYFLLEPK